MPLAYTIPAVTDPTTPLPYEPPDPDRASSAEPTTIDYQKAEQRHDPYAAFRIRDYRLYSAGWFLAVIGFHLQGATVQWEVFKWTGSALHLGLVGGVMALPLLMMGLHAGHIADRYDRQKLAAWGSVMTAIVSLALCGLSYTVSQSRIGMNVGLPLFYVLLFIGGSVATFTRPARAALMPQLVPADIFPNAVTWNSSIFEVASMIGPAIAGFAIAAYSPRMAYLLAAATAVAFAVLLFMMRRRPVERHAHDPAKDELLAGLRFVFRSKILLAAITLDLFAVLLGGAVYLIPQFSEEILRVGPRGFGFLRAAPAVGALSMALFLAHRAPMKHAGRALLLTVIAFGAATLLFAISRNFYLSLLALFLTGVFDNISVVIRHTLVQLLTPDSMRGRVSAVNTIFIGSSNEIGGLRAGVASWLMGPTLSVLTGGIGTILVTLAVAARYPQLRRLGALNEVRPETQIPAGGFQVVPAATAPKQ